MPGIVFTNRAADANRGVHRSQQCGHAKADIRLRGACRRLDKDVHSTSSIRIGAWYARV